MNTPGWRRISSCLKADISRSRCTNRKTSASKSAKAQVFSAGVRLTSDRLRSKSSGPALTFISNPGWSIASLGRKTCWCLSVPSIRKGWIRISSSFTSRTRLRFRSEVMPEFYAFGEILWDCLPSGKHAGGAPFNVAAHLAQIGVSSALISCVGRDPLGEEIGEVAGHKRVNVEFVTRARIGLPTGTVLVTLDEHGNATYELVRPAAWDEIRVPAEALDAVTKARAFIYGSLAGRSPYNLEQIDRLLNVKGPMKFFDVNLRPPFADPPLVMDLAKRADVLKLNDGEVGQLASWIQTGESIPDTPRDDASIARDCQTLAEATKVMRVCVTRAEQGAALWERGNLTTAPAPHVEVKDTVGAGDAFMAGLMVGLTRGMDHRGVLESACRLGAYVAAHDGATHLLPRHLTQPLRSTDSQDG